MAMAVFNKYIAGSTADSRGTKVQDEGITLEEFGAKNTIRILQEDEHIDARAFTSKSLQPEDLDKYDTVIVMSEPENTPPWLEKHPKAERWGITDTKTTDFETSRKIFKGLREKVLARFSKV